MSNESNQEVTFEIDAEPTACAAKAAQDVRLSVSVADGKLQVRSGVRSGLANLALVGGIRDLEVGRFVAVNAPFKLAAQA